MRHYVIEVRKVGKVGRGNRGGNFRFRAEVDAPTGNAALAAYMNRKVGKARTVRSLDGRKEFRAVLASE